MSIWILLFTQYRKFFFDLTASLRQVFQPKASFLGQNFPIVRFFDLTMIVFWPKKRKFRPILTIFKIVRSKKKLALLINNENEEISEKFHDHYQLNFNIHDLTFIIWQHFQIWPMFSPRYSQNSPWIYFPSIPGDYSADFCNLQTWNLLTWFTYQLSKSYWVYQSIYVKSVELKMLNPLLQRWWGSVTSACSIMLGKQ